MPNHKTHDILGITTAASLGVACLYVATPEVAIGLALGLVIGTIWLSPDLDLDSRIYNRWGILRGFWYPYKKLVHHRSIISHSGLFSATIRLFYLLVPIIVVLYAINPQNITILRVLIENNPIFCLFLYLGVVLADFIHCLADYLT